MVENSIKRLLINILVFFRIKGLVINILVLFRSVLSRITSLIVGIKPLTVHDHRTDKKILYILGSGSSVTKLEKSHWHKIAQEVSIGINYWVLHDFVPDFYAIENPEKKKSIVSDFKQYFDRPDIIRKKPFILFYSNRIRSDMIPVPLELRSMVRTYTRCFLGDVGKKSLKRGISKILSSLKGGIYPSNVLFGQGASIERMISFGLLMGVQEIVLIGVDLNNVSYFWEEAGYVSKISIPSVDTQQSSIHRTANPDEKRLTVLDILPLVAEILKKDYSVQLYVENPESMLAGLLPVYQWDISNDSLN